LPFSFDAATAAALLQRSGRAEIVVDANDTAIAAGSGDLPVLATPRLVALMEQAACEALAGELPADHTSVGSHIDLRHKRPSVLGSRVRAAATIAEVSGGRVLFAIEAVQVNGEEEVIIGTGTHTRVVVRREDFTR
jgi:fluoroacetyl-CoA thioesterase